MYERENVQSFFNRIVVLLFGKADSLFGKAAVSASNNDKVVI